MMLERSRLGMAHDPDHLAENPAEQLAWRRRHIRITRAILAGETLRTVAAQESKSMERIRQIVHVTYILVIKVAMQRVKFPTQADFSMASMRKHRRFWLARLATLERIWKCREEKAKDGRAGAHRRRARSSETLG